MNPTPSFPVNLRCLGAAALLTVAALTTGCGGEKAFFKVNGQVVSREEYYKKLERQQMNLGNNVTVTAEPYVIDQLVSNKIMLAEAAKMGVMPSDDEINKLFQAQKDIYENRVPGKKYDEFLAGQGITADEIKTDLRAQVAEANVYAKQLNLNEDEVRKKYEEVKERLGLPARTQMRLILAPASSPLYGQAEKAVADAKNDAKKFEDAARKFNAVPALKSAGGMQIIPNQQVPLPIQGKLLQAAEGTVVGPIDWPIGPGQSLKGWARIEKKLPAFNLPQDQATALVRISLIQQKALLPENATQRNGIMKQKLDAKFESDDTSAMAIWSSIKQQANEQGLGQAAAAPAAAPVPGADPAAAPAPGGGAPK